MLGTDLDQVRAELVSLVDRLPAPDRDADVRLWVDRSFTVRGAGTVVTGTLAAGTIRVGDELEHAGRRVTVRGLQSLGQDQTEVAAVARVAVNLRGIDRQHIGRGDTVRTPGAWLDTAEIDVALRAAGELHRQLVLHIGSAAVPVHVRPLGTAARGCGWRARCRCASATSGCCGTPASTASRRASRCSTCVRRSCVAAAPHATGPTNWRPDAPARRYARAQMSCAPWVLQATGQRVGDWVVDPQWWAERRQQMMTAVKRWVSRSRRRGRHAAGDPAPAGRAARRRAGAQLLDGTGLEVADGLVRQPDTGLPPRVDKAVRTLEERLAAEPFRAPEADELKELKLGTQELAAAVRAGRLTRIADGVVLGPDAFDRAAEVLKTLPQPFTVSDASRALGTTRRVAVPLLEQLDARRITRRADDGTRTVV